MNNKIQKINEEKILFFDAEVVRRVDELEVDSEEFKLFQKKTRNRDTDEYLPDEEVVEEYQKRAALKMCYGKVVTIGVGFIKDGIPYIKDISGEEDEVIKKFCEIASQFEYVCGANVIGYDLPVITNSGWRYFNMAELLPDRFIVNGKKPWNMDKTIDLMDCFKGTHYYNSSVEEICYHFNIPTPKDDISGAEVSEVYWNGDRERIYTYVKKDVFANINIFRKMQGKDIFEDFVDRSEPKKEPIPVLKRLRNFNEITPDIEKELLEILSGEVEEREIKYIEEILKAAFFRDDFISGDQDKKDVRTGKEETIKLFLEDIRS